MNGGSHRADLLAGGVLAVHAGNRLEDDLRTAGWLTSKISVQQLPGDAAVVHFNVLVNPPAGVDAPALERTLLLVVAKQQDGWKIAAGQLTKPNCPGE